LLRRLAPRSARHLILKNIVQGSHNRVRHVVEVAAKYEPGGSVTGGSDEEREEGRWKGNESSNGNKQTNESKIPQQKGNTPRCGRYYDFLNIQNGCYDPSSSQSQEPLCLFSTTKNPLNFSGRQVRFRALSLNPNSTVVMSCPEMEASSKKHY
jgi:hypothetical protein